MTPDQIAVDQVLAGRGADADKTREVLAIAPNGDVRTRVRRNGEDLGESTLHINILARWADRIIETTKSEA